MQVLQPARENLKGLETLKIDEPVKPFLSSITQTPKLFYSCRFFQHILKRPGKIYLYQ